MNFNKKIIALLSLFCFSTILMPNANALLNELPQDFKEKIARELPKEGVSEFSKITEESFLIKENELKTVSQEQEDTFNLENQEILMFSASPLLEVKEQAQDEKTQAFSNKIEETSEKIQSTKLVNSETLSESKPLSKEDDKVDLSIQDASFCTDQNFENEVLSATIVSVRKKFKVEQGEKYRIKVFIKNTGNTSWFSNNANCKTNIMYLGLDSPRDRNASISDNITNRVSMDQLRVDPNEIASFTFWQVAPRKNDLIKEYFTPVIEGKKWLDKSRFSVETLIGTLNDNPKEIREKLSFAVETGSVLDLDLNAERKIVVDVSDQEMYVYLGDKIIRTFRVSTGKRSTPTPYGETKITLKQWVRVGASPPHYIMPRFMMFRAGGYGIHALPSLGNDRGRFWTEARSHIGISVSHGCIRLLPEDADFLFEFTPIGTTVVVRP
jgi:hypothetical protein